MTSLLNAATVGLLETGYEIGLNWLGQIVKAIVGGVGIIGVGIILFTLVLKAITLPFDIYQRVKMRKQTLIMREMQPELEKLQKQYANDKSMYQQKMMELYKKNGYSMLGACLPMIISLVILIVAFSAFRTYSNYANLEMYVNMSKTYNAAILEHSVDGINYTLKKDENNALVLEGGNYILTWQDEDGEEHSEPLTWVSGGELPGKSVNGITYTMTDMAQGSDKIVKHLTVKEEGKFLYYSYSLEEIKVNRKYEIDKDLLIAQEAARGIDVPAEVKKLMDESLEDDDPEDDETIENNLTTEDMGYERYVTNMGSAAVAEWYKDNNAGFLWIRNVWYPDVSYSHPIQDYKSFQSSLDVDVEFPDGREESLASVLDKDDYNNLTRGLTEEKSQANGYFILIILSIGFMVLSQWITMRSSKESNKYQTVDGQGARMQKIMLVVMPLMYAVFAFMNSAAFAIYMTMSSIIAILVTLLSNLIIGKIFKKKEEEQIKAKYTRTVPWKMKEENKPAKNDKKNKKK